MDEKRKHVLAAPARRIAGAVIATGAGAAFLAAGIASAQPSDHVVSPSVVQPGGTPGGTANHWNVPPGSALWPGNMNPDSSSSADTGSSSATPIDPGDHPREAPGTDTPRF